MEWLKIFCESTSSVNRFANCLPVRTQGICCFEFAEIDFASNIEGFLADEIRIWFRKGLRYRTQDVQQSVKDM